MAAIDVAREKTEKDALVGAQNAANVVSRLQEALSEARELETQVKVVEADAKSLREAEALPMEFTGKIHSYRFGMLDVGLPEEGAAKAGARPSHRFEVEVPGVGLWLHVRVPSDRFDDFLARTDIVVFEGGESLNGKMVTVRRDPKLGYLIPIGLGVTTVDPKPLGKDKAGNEIFKGDTIRARRYFGDRSFRATVLSFTGRKWIVQRPDRQNPSEIPKSDVARYVVFAKID